MAEMNQPLKTVLDRFQAYKAVTWALDTQWQLVEQAVGVDTATEQSQNVEKLRESLDKAYEDLKEAHQRLLDERSQDLEARQERDAAHKALNETWLQGRKTIVGVAGEDRLQTLGFTRRLPTTIAALAVQTRFLARKLLEAADTLPKGGPGFTLDLPVYVNEALLPALERLEQAENRVGKEAKVTETAVAFKDEALEKFNLEFYQDALIVEAMFRRAGLDRIAERVRPSGRHRGTVVEPFDEDTSTGDDVTDPDVEPFEEPGDDAGDDEDVLTFV